MGADKPRSATAKNGKTNNSANRSIIITLEFKIVI